MGFVKSINCIRICVRTQNSGHPWAYVVNYERTQLPKRAICTRKPGWANNLSSSTCCRAPMGSATLQMATSKFVLCPNVSPLKIASPRKTITFGSNFKVRVLSPDNGSASSCSSRGTESSLKADETRRRSNLESLFCYDKAVPEEIIEKPVGLSLAEKAIGNNPQCSDCHAKGAVLCATCAGSGLYVDSIMESQGIIVKVRCLGCGGTGNIMCTECGGRGHL